MKSINPATGEIIGTYKEHSTNEVSQIIDHAHHAWTIWRDNSFATRAAALKRAAQLLREHKEAFARLMTQEMGKLLREAMAEVEKCAWVCDYYAEHGEALLQDEVIPTDASRSLIAYQPLGIILAVMPWNFPFWQVFRFAAPSLMAGNAAVLKHASNVTGCALAIEEIFRKAGFPEDLFRTLIIPSAAVQAVIDNPKIAAATLTGSESAGSHVASAAGKQIKPTLLELGGSDAFIVLEDADIDAAVKTAVTARMLNQGQSCIASKRFILVDQVADEFITKLKSALGSMKMGDPLNDATQIGPLARPDLVDEIERQVNESLREGAVLVMGGKRGIRPETYYEPTILDGVGRGMTVYHQETFGPVVAVIRVRDEEEAIAVANDSEFGLGGCVWTRDKARGEAVARKVETGAMFVNGMTKSDPRLPFGGIKKSGYGRELGVPGIRQFVNAKTIWVG